MILKKHIKNAIHFIQKKKRINELKNTSPMITKEKLVDDLRAAGLGTGDVVFLHSSLKRIGFVEGGPQTVIDSIIDVLTSDGTLIVPTYFMKGTMFQTCLDDQYVFDVRNSPTVLGAIPSYVLKIKGAKRSIHPTHSVSAIGKNASYITDAHHIAKSTFGEDSPWDRFLKLNGKLMGLGIGVGPVTFYHVLEDTMGDKFPVPVRMKVTYSLSCLDWQGKRINVSINPLDPTYSSLRIDHADRQDLRNYFYKLFSSTYVITPCKVGQADSWVSDANKLYCVLEELALKGITIYTEENDLKQFDE